jgi:penicillin V acylase-like amidase (Ntn superfamily)
MSFLFTIFTLISHIFACSSFLIPAKGIMAKNYDWSIADGYVMTNAKGTQKTSLTVRSTDLSLSWESKFSSITFNQYGRDFPNGGINEKGLAIEILWLNSSVYPPRDNRETVNELQWIQYQLDNYSTVAEIAANINKIRVAKVYADVHYFACDANLKCATIEFISGKADVHYGSTLPYPSITNSTYRASKAFIKDYQGFGGNFAIPQTYKSLDRFVRATHLAGLVEASDNARTGFDILDSLESVGYTKWQILYDLKSKVVEFRTKFSNRNIATFAFSDISQTCKGTPYYVDLKGAERGNNLTWLPLTKSKNDALIRSSFGQLYGDQVPQALLTAVSNHPYTYSCQ